MVLSFPSFVRFCSSDNFFNHKKWFQVGLFRKSGVKSRIAKLKELIEDSHGDVMETYDLQQAYDVADMLKQYFRELPDTLLTAKMSDTFIAIFQRKTVEHFNYFIQYNSN